MSLPSNILFRTAKLNNEHLQNYIAYYYFQEAPKDNGLQEYVFYPHFKNALTIYKGSRLEKTNNGSISEKSIDRDELHYNYICVQQQCWHTQIKTPFNRIGIVFQPLGINHYLPLPLSQYITRDYVFQFDFLSEK
jgi:hypothetical protein